MTMLIENPRLEEELQERRKAWGADQHDEVWESKTRYHSIHGLACESY